VAATKRPAQGAQAPAARQPDAPSASYVVSYWEHSALPVKKHGELFIVGPPWRMESNAGQQQVSQSDGGPTALCDRAPK
jgi:hypothetical protein